MNINKYLFYVFIILAMVCVTTITGEFIRAINRSTYDVNNDKVVNSEDLLELRKYLLEIEG